MRQTHLICVQSEIIPEQLEDGYLYVSKKYGTGIHKCCCGCGEEVVTPISPTDWQIRFQGNSATLHPSIGNWSLPCRSHYWIRRGKVIWAGDMSDGLIHQNRIEDLAEKKIYYKKMNNPIRLLCNRFRDFIVKLLENN